MWGSQATIPGAENTPRPVLTTFTVEQVRGAPRDRLDQPVPLAINSANQDQSCLPIGDKNSNFYTGAFWWREIPYILEG